MNKEMLSVSLRGILEAKSVIIKMRPNESSSSLILNKKHSKKKKILSKTKIRQNDWPQTASL